jgi:hypothetical protein
MDFGSTLNTRSTQPISRPKINSPSTPRDREKGWRPLICDAIHRHELYPEIVVLSVQSGPGGTGTLYSVFDRKLLDHRTPFVARVDKNGSIEISTLNTQIAVPDEIRLIAYESPKNFPQPWRDKFLGVKNRAKKSSPTSTPTQESIQVDSKSKKLPRTDLTEVQISYKHRRPDSVKPKHKRPVLKLQNTELIKNTSTAPSIEQSAKPSQSPKHTSSLKKPMTIMELAFHKLAEKQAKDQT